MNGIIKKKLNLLVHLACIDGHFHKSEKELILKLVGDRNTLDPSFGYTDPLVDVDTIHDKEEILHLALQMIQADKVITEGELKFCRALATKLGFREGVADQFAHHPLPPLPEFIEQLNAWRIY